MTRREQLKAALFPIISQVQRDDDFIDKLIEERVCPADKIECSEQEDCRWCWGREVEEAHDDLIGGKE